MRTLAFPLLALAAAVPAPAQTNANAEPLAAARAFDDAQQRRDGPALERMIAPDFLIVHGSGKVGDRSEFIGAFTKAGTKFEPFVITDRLFLRVSPDVAIAGGEAWMRGVEDGKRFAQHFRYADTFLRRDGRWVAVYTQVTPLP